MASDPTTERIELVCSAHTISGAMPNGPVVARHGFEERVRACAAAGYAGMTFHYRDYRDQRRLGRSDAEMRALLDSAGMRHRTVEFSADWFLDERTPGAAESAMHAACAGLGAPLFVVGGDLAGHGVSLEAMRPRFHDLCRRAADRGLSVGFEIVAWGNVTSVDDALRLLDGAPANGGLVIDSWHVFRGGIALGDLARLPPERILGVQIDDAAAEPSGPLPEDTLHRLPCGRGAFDLAGFRDALRAIGVDLPWCVEIIAPEIATMDAGRCARETHDSALEALAGTGERRRGGGPTGQTVICWPSSTTRPDGIE